MRLSLLLALLVASGCSAVTDTLRGDATVTDPPDTVEAYRADRAEMMAQLDAAIGQAQADDVQACRVVAVGAKACGGPATHRVYSATDGDAAEIEALAERITELDDYANGAFGLVSNCMVEAEPAPALTEGRCTASGPR
ncbi:MAG: hypothetical protein AAGJ11_03875 [Bacteroidota bacterium]